MTSPIGNARNSRTGFTLVEVLVAVVILSVGIASVLAAYNVCMSALGVSSDACRANLLLKNKLDAIITDGALNPPAGVLAESSDGFRCRTEMSAVAGGHGNAGLMEVSVTVSRDPGAAHSAATCMRNGKSRK